MDYAGPADANIPTTDDTAQPWQEDDSWYRNAPPPALDTPFGQMQMQQQMRHDEPLFGSDYVFPAHNGHAMPANNGHAMHSVDPDMQALFPHGISSFWPPVEQPFPLHPSTPQVQGPPPPVSNPGWFQHLDDQPQTLDLVMQPFVPFHHTTSAHHPIPLALDIPQGPPPPVSDLDSSRQQAVDPTTPIQQPCSPALDAQLEISPISDPDWRRQPGLRRRLDEMQFDPTRAYDLHIWDVPSWLTSLDPSPSVPVRSFDLTNEAATDTAPATADGAPTSQPVDSTETRDTQQPSTSNQAPTSQAVDSTEIQHTQQPSTSNDAPTSSTNGRNVQISLVVKSPLLEYVPRRIMMNLKTTDSK